MDFEFLREGTTPSYLPPWMEVCYTDMHPLPGEWAPWMELSGDALHPTCRLSTDTP